MFSKWVKPLLSNPAKSTRPAQLANPLGLKWNRCRHGPPTTILFFKANERERRIFGAKLIPTSHGQSNYTRAYSEVRHRLVSCARRAQPLQECLAMLAKGLRVHSPDGDIRDFAAIHVGPLINRSYHFEYK